VARFCSAACQRAGTVDLRKKFGEEHPHWKGGRATYRERALRERGAVCEICGYDKHATLLWVHHKNLKPRAVQDDHSLDNLEVLCIRCHLEKHLEVGKQAAVGRVVREMARG
jgi:hypothetical protein